MALYPQHSSRFSELTTRAIRLGIKEDVGGGDVTSLATIPESAVGEAFFLVKHETPIILAGLPVVELVAAEFGLHFESNVRDGEELSAGQTFGTLSGSLRQILSAERLALNLLQRASGIATFTKQFVGSIAGTHAQICDTRKTDPCWRELAKYAVSVGGGINHRHALYDMFLIKNNHIDSVSGDIKLAIRRCREFRPELSVECEVRDLDELTLALEELPDGILLDNFSLSELRDTVAKCRSKAPKVKLEYSGGARLDRIRAIAECGVDYISVGALTHSYPNADISLRIGEHSGRAIQPSLHP